MTCPTGKRCFQSRKAARQAHAKVHNKVRVYFCKSCHAYHCTSNVGGGQR